MSEIKKEYIMKKSKILKLFITVLVIVLVFAFASTAFAESKTFYLKRIYGGPSQVITTPRLARDRALGIGFYVTYINWNDQSEFRYRGYNDATGEVMSERKEIFDINVNYNALYTEWTFPDWVRVKASIESTDTNVFLTFSGTVDC